MKRSIFAGECLLQLPRQLGDCLLVDRTEDKAKNANATHPKTPRLLLESRPSSSTMRWSSADDDKD